MGWGALYSAEKEARARLLFHGGAIAGRASAAQLPPPLPVPHLLKEAAVLLEERKRRELAPRLGRLGREIERPRRASELHRRCELCESGLRAA